MSLSPVMNPRAVGRRLAARQGLAPYRPFGRTLTRPTNPALHIGFTGHDRTTADTSVNLIYMNARYYMPGIGRFLSPDTLIPDPAESQAFNRYAYVLGNPIKYVDPSGYCGTLAGGGRDPQDALCWNQYDDFVGRLISAGFHDFVPIIGTGEDWTYRNDFESSGMTFGEALVQLHVKYGLSWDYLLGNRWGATIPYRRSMAARSRLGNLEYDRVNIGRGILGPRYTVCIYQAGKCNELYTAKYDSLNPFSSPLFMIGTEAELKPFIESLDNLLRAELATDAAKAVVLITCSSPEPFSKPGCPLAIAAWVRFEADEHAAFEKSINKFNEIWYKPGPGIIRKWRGHWFWD